MWASGKNSLSAQRAALALLRDGLLARKLEGTDRGSGYWKGPPAPEGKEPNGRRAR
jgi:hypothetical protein